ncbi:MAG: site-specific DNA-methyltransferase [Thaumarchaeota archaeon]|nr:site-specific DNA-methyltransferase [Nitrososphaerota archaeon]
MGTKHKVIFGNSMNMSEIRDESIHLVVTSPPYFNAPFDYPDFFKTYRDFEDIIQGIASELYRVVAKGRICCFIVDDMLVDGDKFPVVADVTKHMMKAGFRYRDKIIWIKPKGYIRISRRSGVLLQHPYPMYFYPDNLQESILIFQKGRFDYSYLKTLPKKTLDASRIDTKEFNESKTSLTVWDGFLGEERATFPDTWRITNVLPIKGRIEEGVAAFPEEIPRRLIKLFTFVGETVLDPFTGSGTTLKVARDLGRNSFGYELDLELKSALSRRLEYNGLKLSEDTVEFEERDDARHFRTIIQKKVKEKAIATQR